MIIISNKPGQLGNLLFIYANFLAYGIDNNVSIINPSFHHYRGYFKSTKVFSIINNKLFYSICYAISRALFRLRIKNKIINVIALDWAEAMDLDNAPELRSSLCFVQGWLFRSNRLFENYAGDIRKFFIPSDYLKQQLDKFFHQKFSDRSETVIGIHVRRGDYKSFESGKYLYSLEEYKVIITQLEKLFKDKKPHFLVCSNEKINFEFEKTNNPKITYAPGHEFLDMYCLANCNYIAGPPSTYSMWASFYGNKLLYQIKNVSKDIQYSDFRLTLS